MTDSIHSDEMRALCAWLRDQREAAKLPMRALAQKLGKPHSYVQKIEQGDRRLDVVEFCWYCAALNVRPDGGLAAIRACRDLRQVAMQPW